MPNFILANPKNLVNLDNVNSITIDGDIESTNPDEPMRLNIRYANKQLEQIETTLEYVIPTMCIALDVCEDDDYDDELDECDEEFADFCLHCQHIDNAFDEMPCCNCIHNIDDETMEPIGDTNMFEENENRPFYSCGSLCEFDNEDYEENADDDE